MLRTAGLVLFCATLAACGAYVPPDTARMPMSQSGTPVLSENDAINLVEYELARPESTRGNPEAAARTLAAADWLAGQDGLNGDYGEYRPVTRVLWHELRQEVRQSIGVAPGTPSQVVVEHLLSAAQALRHGDKAAALAELQPPAFTLGAEQTLAVLGNLPAYPGQPAASSELQSHLHRSSPCRFPMVC